MIPPSRPSRALRSLLVLLAGAALSLGLLPAVAATAAEPGVTALSTQATPARAGERGTVSWNLVDADGAEVVGRAVITERRRGGAWVPLGTRTTTGEGPYTTSITMVPEPADNVVRVRFAGDAEHAPSVAVVPVALLRSPTTVRLSGPREVVDERSVALRVQWTAGGRGVAGTVVLQRRQAGEGWRRATRVTTNARGRASVRVAPRVDTRYRVRAPQQPWTRAATSRVHRVANLPPGRVVRLPAAAPRPRITLPPQPRATGAGANLVVSGIPGRVWSDMTGRSWRPGCPLGRSDLRLIRVNYWAYDGYRRRGEVVASASAAGRMGAALAAMYRQRLPIRSMYRVDRFGFSGRLQGGDDYRSMAAGNTSAYNCRWVVGRPGVRSPHSYGGSLDVNTWENPYRSRTGLVPNTWWMARSHPLVAWRSASHRVVRLMSANGLAWTYGLGDTHHFDVRRAGRVPVYAGCARVRCD